MHLIENTTLLAIVACLGLAFEGSKKMDKNPLMLLGSGLLLVFVTFRHLFADDDFFWAIPDILKDLGIGLLAGAAMFAFRKAASKSWLLGGLVLVGMAGAWYGGKHLWNQYMGTEKQFMVELGADDRIEEILPTFAHYDVRYEKAFPTVSLAEDENLAQYYLVTIKGTERDFTHFLAAVKADTENVDSAEWNVPMFLEPNEVATNAPETDASFLSNDPKAKEQWALKAIYADAAFANLKDAQPQKKALVAILDTGVDSKHEDLKDVYRQSPATTDGHGHGTHCAGIAGAATNNGVGIASLNWDGKFVQIAGFSALSSSGSGSAETISQAIVDASKAGADVISMSLGGYSPFPPKVEVDAIRFALRKGSIVLAAAGNSNENAKSHAPANIDGVITVSAVDRNKNKASFSNTNNGLKRPIAAPGVEIMSTKPKNMYQAHSGTSMATPLVAGLVGVMRAFKPNLSAEEAYNLLNKTGQTVNDSPRVGRVINADAAIRAVM
jgi:thermitase